MLAAYTGQLCFLTELMDTIIAAVFSWDKNLPKMSITDPFYLTQQPHGYSKKGIHFVEGYKPMTGGCVGGSGIVVLAGARVVVYRVVGWTVDGLIEGVKLVFPVVLLATVTSKHKQNKFKNI